MTTTERKPGHTVRIGDGRATYRPDWSRLRPWAIYVNGEARNTAASECDAVMMLREMYHCRGPEGHTP